MAEIDDKFYSLKEAKESPDWPQWKCVIQSKQK
jgi:hypothetical protein